MSIIGTLPVNLANGTTADASQVMSDLNFIANQVNANGMPANVTSLPNVTSVGGSVTIGSITAGPSATFTTNGVAGQVNLNVFNTNTHGNWFLDTIGNVGFFDNSRSLTRFQSDTSGNFLAAGNITSNSDERLKENWSPMPDDFVERLALVKSGAYDRKDIQHRQVGVGAQSLQKLMPEAVIDNGGTLAVAYGQAALVACVELAKEVVRLRALLESVK